MHMSTYVWGMLKGKWNPITDTHPSFEGRNVIITGANVGVGLEAALKFVQLGAKKVILGVRAISKGETARDEIETRSGKKNVVEVWQLDMMDYNSIKAFAARATNDLGHLDIAVLNAGIVNLDFKKSSYGWEETLQVNVLSTALLGLLLRPKLAASKTPTFTPVLEIVASGNAYIVDKLRSTTSPLDAYNTPTGYSGASQYSVSKLFDVFLQRTMAGITSKSGSDGPQFYVVSVCPGPTRSQLARDANAKIYMKPFMWLFSTLVQHPPEVGARIYISGIGLGSKGHGKFWKDDTIWGPAPTVEGELGQKTQDNLWNEIIEALAKDVPEVRDLARP